MSSRGGREPGVLGCAVASMVGVVFWLVVVLLALWFPVGTVLAVVIVAVAFVAGN